MHSTLVQRDCSKLGGIKALERLHQAVLDEKLYVSAIIAPVFPFQPVLLPLGSFGPLITPPKLLGKRTHAMETHDCELRI